MPICLTSDQMRAVERAAIDSGRVTGQGLMERAGEGVVSAILDYFPALAAVPGRALVLCGPGNNGGDGFVVARLLRARGWRVELRLLGEVARLTGDAATACRNWGGEILPLDETPDDALQAADLVVDALFGTGLQRPLSPDLAGLLHRAARRPLVAVDILSGICADSGRLLADPDRAAQAALTVTFDAPKRGHLMAEGAARSGALAVVPIGLAREVEEASRDPAVARCPDAATLDPRALGKAGGGHKYAHGHVLVLSGGPGRGGAARMAARGALRMGAGLVTLGCPPDAVPENAGRLDAIMLRPVADAVALGEMLEDARLDTLCLGPGLGHGDSVRDTVLTALRAGRGTVLDADALTNFKDDPETLFAALHPGAAFTPHPGEFARLFPDLAGRLKGVPEHGPAYSKADAAAEAAARSGAVVLLKGVDTVVAAPDGRLSLHAAVRAREVPWLATAGAGDVLAGFAAGLLARGLPAFEAAEAAVWLHAETARRFGPGLIAEDLPETLPAVLRDLAPAG